MCSRDQTRRLTRVFLSSLLLSPPPHHSTVPEEENEVLLSPEVTYGPPGLELSCPVALSVAHCADLSSPADATWAVRLKRRTPENKWEVTSPSP